MSALELDVDLGPRLLGAVSRSDQAVVGEDKPHDDQGDDPDYDPDFHQLTYPTARTRRLRVGAPSPSGLLKHLLVLVLAHLLAPLLDYRAPSNSLGTHGNFEGGSPAPR